MNTNILEGALKSVLFTDDLDILVLDVFEDKTTKYNLVSGEFTVINNGTLTDYLESVKSKVDKEYVSGFMNLVSIPKLKEQINEDNKYVEYEYKDINGKNLKTCALLLNDGTNDLIFLLTSKEENKVNNVIENDSKFNSLINVLSDVILKINNVFEAASEGKTKLKDVGDYVDSLHNKIISSYPELKLGINKTAANVSGRKDDVILIVDDDALMRNMIKKIFKDEYKMVTASNGKEALEYLEENSKKGINESSDNILTIFLDLTMPVMDGFAVLEYLSKNNYLNRIPVIIISGDYEKETKARVYNYGVADMLEKPFDFEVVRHRINNFINLYKSSNSLNNIVNEESRDLKELINPFVEAYKFDYEQNINKISKVIKIIGKKLMEDYPDYNLNMENIEKMASASMYYDIGFYSIPRLVLSKKTFNESDVQKIKAYPNFGSKMLDYVLSLTSDTMYKKYAKNITLTYHENYDGTGYPNGLSGDEIPLEAQIAAVAIAYTNLSKKDGIDPVSEIVNKSGSAYNPKIVGTVMKLKEELKNI